MLEDLVVAVFLQLLPLGVVDGRHGIYLCGSVCYLWLEPVLGYTDYGRIS